MSTQRLRPSLTFNDAMTDYLIETYGPEIEIAKEFRSLEARRWMRLGFLFRDCIGSHKADPKGVRLAAIERRTAFVHLVNDLSKTDDKTLEELKRMLIDEVSAIKMKRKRDNLGNHG